MRKKEMEVLTKLKNIVILDCDADTLYKKVCVCVCVCAHLNTRIYHHHHVYVVSSGTQPPAKSPAVEQSGSIGRAKTQLLCPYVYYYFTYNF